MLKYPVILICGYYCSPIYSDQVIMESSLYESQPPSQCTICSYRQPINRPSRAVHHHHFSTQFYRSLVGPAWLDPSQYICPTCKVTHPNTPKDSRLKILVSSSILHQYWLPRGGNLYEGDQIHVDQVTIPGARVDNLHLAWRYNYG